MTKVIHTAIAAPGAGKTKALINQLPELFKQGEKVIIAFPTLKLCIDVIAEMQRHGLNPKVINSQICDEKSSSKSIEGTLRNGNEELIVVTHEGLRLSDPKLLRNFTLIIDEVPDVFGLQHILNLRQGEVERIFSEVDSIDQMLCIKAGKMSTIKERIRTYKSSTIDKTLTSTLSEAEFKIFNTLCNKGIVHFEKITNSTQPVYNFFAIERKSLFKHIQSAKETHILAANINGGIFDCFAKLHGYQFKKSKFTPNHFEYSCPITIYPMLSQPWSKGKVLLDVDGKRHERHLDQGSTQVIDQVFISAYLHSPKESFIAIQNSWGCFDSKYRNFGVSFPSFDCRGLNTHQDKTAAMLLFSGRPSPNDKKSLRVIAKTHGINISELEKAWIVKNKLEASLQAATRTAIRNRNNKQHVRLYVQDMEVAEYLTRTYMKSAIIDTTLSITPPQRPDGRSTTTASEDELMNRHIDTLARQGIKRSEINKEIVQRWPISISKARRRTKYLATTENNKPEGLSKFFS